jgi:hypothetical protein
MTYVAKISLPGFDVKTATPEQCAVHSEYPPFKSKLNQVDPHFATLNVDFTAAITQNVTLTVFRIPHNYGYVPLTIPNIVFRDGVLGLVIVGIGFAGVGATLAINAFCDSTYFYVQIYDNASWVNSNSTLEVSYYIFSENGT